jgi:aspartate carbamoyltransferase regulatory subunit
MNDADKLFSIPKIEHGIVIDHIPAGWGLKLLEIIHGYPEMTSVVATVGLNYVSRKLGKKDMIKLAIEELPPSLLEHVSLIRAGVTIKRIKNYEVEKKFVVQFPEQLVDQARCRNPNCITNHERDVATRFRRVDPKGERFQCAFCERIFPIGELEVRIPEP